MRCLYAPIQFIPSEFRAECVNIGLAIYVPPTKSVIAEHVNDLGRVARLFFMIAGDVDRLAHEADLFVNRLTSIERFDGESDFVRFYETSMSRVRLGVPKPMITEDPEREFGLMLTEIVPGMFHVEHSGEDESDARDALDALDKHRSGLGSTVSIEDLRRRVLG